MGSASRRVEASDDATTPAAVVKALEECALEIRLLRGELRELRGSVRVILDSAKGSALGTTLLGWLARRAGKR